MNRHFITSCAALAAVDHDDALGRGVPRLGLV